jgi:hypothetical protein
VNFNFSIFLIFRYYKYDDTKMLQVTSRRKGKGNELNCSLDELQWGSANDIT